MDLGLDVLRLLPQNLLRVVRPAELGRVRPCGPARERNVSERAASDRRRLSIWLNRNHHARKERVEARAPSEHAAVLHHTCVTGAGPVMFPDIIQDVIMQDSIALT